jgi:hypothetical protein
MFDENSPTRTSERNAIAPCHFVAPFRPCTPTCERALHGFPQPSSSTPLIGSGQSRRNDCEDRLCSLMVMGCGLATASVTPGKTGFRAFVRHVRSRSPAPARSEELA